MRPELDRKHDNGWKQVCNILGGSSERCHNINLSPARHTKKYLYTATCSFVIELSSVRHNKIIRCGEYTLRNTGDELNQQCEYKRIA